MSVFLLPVHMDLRDHISLNIKKAKKEIQTFLQSWHQLIDNILHCSVMAEGNGETEMNTIFSNNMHYYTKKHSWRTRNKCTKMNTKKIVFSHLHSAGT